MIEALERAVATSPAPEPETAREALAAEWRAANPQTPEQIAAFYQHAEHLGADLEAWHAGEARQAVTAMLVHVAKEIHARCVVDIGCGAGHDLLALHAALPETALHGVEPNRALRRRLPRDLGITLYEEITSRFADDDNPPIASGDLLICIDVLEHAVDPESFLGSIAARAKIGCVLFEATATFDTGTPLHLPANRGWHPGRCLERYGWVLVDHTGTPGQEQRVRVWRRMAETGTERASLLLCAYRSVSTETMQAILNLTAGVGHGWRLRAKTGDALISRSRSIVVSKWFTETNDDVFLMVDDDVVFSPMDADRLIELCRNGYDVVCGAYPVHNGAHFACRCWAATTDISFGPGQTLIDIQYAATGFMAVHRRVIDALVQTLPLCHASESWSFWPLFQPMIAENAAAGGHEWLSEDYGFSELARRAGFRVWLDPQVRLQHLGAAPISVANMAGMHDAIKHA